MIEVIDRVPTYPGRVTLTPVAGTTNTYDMVRADEPIEEGTPINRALFKSLSDELSAMLQQINDRLFEMTQRVRIGDLTPGTVISLYENGVLVPFIVLDNGYPQSGRVLVLRQNCVTLDTIKNSGESNYENSKIDVWLNNEYVSMLGPATQGALDTAKITIFTSAQKQIERKVFLLSLSDYSLSLQGMNGFSTALTLFSTNDRRIATLNGTPVNHWTRSPNSTSSLFAYISADGTASSGDPASFLAGIRPALTLPIDFEVTAYVPSTENVMATAEVI